jgi:pimeloyl-ACP methyl ester carboxylesterase
MPLEHQYVRIDDVNIHYVSAEADDKLAAATSTLIFLHGFPEYWQTWQAQLDYFAGHHRLIAPDLPGYNLSDKPQQLDFYQIHNLITFIAKFINTVSPEHKVTLVAHDWGGVIAWPLAAFYPQYIEKLVIINAAHPSTFTREMINNPLQRDKSAYIHALISRDAQTLLTKNNFQYLSETLMTGHANGANKENYTQAWQQPGAINAMLQYYRAMPQLAPLDKAQNQQDNRNTPRTSSSGPVKDAGAMKIPNIVIHLPTLILWGEQDQAFVTENLNGIEQYVPSCTIKRYADASHWLMHEKSDQINQAIADFIT